MGILDSLASTVGDGDKQNDLLPIIMELLGQQGGLNNLVRKFASNGLGDLINSWIGTGNNLPISADQLKGILGDDTISNIASKLGMDSGAVTSQLSNLLPNVIDKLTPEGKAPEGDIMSKGMDLLGGLLGK